VGESYSEVPCAMASTGERGPHLPKPVLRGGQGTTGLRISRMRRCTRQGLRTLRGVSHAISPLSW
jgi:hypothetical protein